MSSHFGGNFTTMVRNSTLDEGRLDDMIIRIMTPYFHLRQDAENDFPTVDASSVFLNWFSNQNTWLRERITPFHTYRILLLHPTTLPSSASTLRNEQSC
jgi:hypothetical protein